MKVVFALRADALTKPGGDSKKVDRYRQGLTELGWDSEVVTSARDLAKTPSDLVHLMNLDTPRENLHYAKIASRSKRPFVISTIRHPFDGMKSMYSYGDDKFYKQLRRVGVQAEVGIGFREQVKLLKQNNIMAASIPGRYRALQQRLVRDAATVFPMASGESEALSRDFNGQTPAKIIRNGFSFSPVETGTATKEFDIISVGRVEPRKNSLALAKAASSTGLKTAFVGSLNDNHRAYANEFLATVAANENLTYLGSKGHQEIMAILQLSHAYINPAWFEVVSQADVEAACMGLRIASTQHSYLEDALGSDVIRFDPQELLRADAGDRLRRIYDSATVVSRVASRDWKECSIELDKAYRQVVSSVW
ncbi:glycosyltransferase [Arthrobacter sp. B6]|uniref:glycosyltransferase n=1 Tax=Arthrobacter sp. B6 TaxID=1570137 RepID=UPI000AC9E425|nr:glycosyltransferase [Arthrobacter sp. B6]